MKRKPSLFQGKLAFTLVELLAVVAIVCILIAITLPIIESVRQRAWNVRCLTNLRQIWIASELYMADNDGRLPPATVVKSNGSSESGLTACLSSYAATPNRKTVGAYRDIFICPEAWSAHSDEVGASNRSYAINILLFDPTVPAEGQLIAGIPHPPQRIWLTDGAWNASLRLWDQACSRLTVSNAAIHQDKINVLYFDGHAESKQPSQLADPKVWNFKK